jgi:hypothetical protein
MGIKNAEFYADFKLVDASFKKYSYKVISKNFLFGIFFEILLTNLESA